VQVSAVSGVLHSNNADTLTSAAIHGAGIALLPGFLVSDLLEHKTLQPVLPGWEAEPLGVYLAYSSRQHQPVRVRKLMDHLRDTLSPGHSPMPRVPDGVLNALQAALA